MTTAQMTQVTKLGRTTESLPREELIGLIAHGALRHCDAVKVRAEIDVGLARRGHAALVDGEWRGVCRGLNHRMYRQQVLKTVAGTWLDRSAVRGGLGIVQYIDAALAAWQFAALTVDEQRMLTNWQAASVGGQAVEAV